MLNHPRCPHIALEAVLKGWPTNLDPAAFAHAAALAGLSGVDHCLFKKIQIEAQNGK